MSIKWGVLVIIAFAIFVVGATLTACSPVTTTERPPKEEIQSGISVRIGVGNGLRRVYDEEAGVYCWTYKMGYAGGVDCLPCQDTILGCGE